MNIRLQRTTEVVCYEVVLEVAMGVDRSDVMAFLMAARESRGQLSVEKVATLLRNHGSRVHRRILRYMLDMDLIDADGRLTTLGEESLAEGRPMIVERGVYKVWVVNDPLHPDRIARVVPSDSQPLYIEVNEARQRYEEGDLAAPTTKVPDWILATQGQTLRTLSGETIRIEKMETNGHRVPSRKDLEFILDLRPDNTVSLQSKGFAKSSLPAPSLTFDSAMVAVLGTMANDWDPAEFRLRRDHSDLTGAQKRSFLMDLTLDRPSIPDLGPFDDTVIEQVPIFPTDMVAAQAWYRWLLTDQLTTYLDGHGLAEHCDTVSRRFEPFAVEPPDRSDLVSDILDEKKQDLPRAYWWLQAPIDLTPGGIA